MENISLVPLNERIPITRTQSKQEYLSDWKVRQNLQQQLCGKPQRHGLVTVAYLDVWNNSSGAGLGRHPPNILMNSD